MSDKYGVSCGCTIETVPMEGMELMHRVVIIHCKLHANAEKMRNALVGARLQIEHLHEKFQETGSGNAMLSRIDAALKELD